MPESPSSLDPARRRRRRHILGWTLASLVIAATVAVVVWAPPARATLVVSLLGVLVTGFVGWYSASRR